MKGLKIRSQYKTDFKNLIKVNYKLIRPSHSCKNIPWPQIFGGTLISSLDVSQGSLESPQKSLRLKSLGRGHFWATPLWLWENL